MSEKGDLIFPRVFLLRVFQVQKELVLQELQMISRHFVDDEAIRCICYKCGCLWSQIWVFHTHVVYIFEFFLCEERIFLCLKDEKRTNNREKKIRLKERKALYSFVYTSVLKQRILIILRWGLMNMPSAISKDEVLVFPTSQGAWDSPLTDGDDWISQETVIFHVA